MCRMLGEVAAVVALIKLEKVLELKEIKTVLRIFPSLNQQVYSEGIGPQKMMFSPVLEIPKGQVPREKSSHAIKDTDVRRQRQPHKHTAKSSHHVRVKSTPVQEKVQRRKFPERC